MTHYPLGTVVDITTVAPDTPDAYDAGWVRWDHPAPAWPRQNSIRLLAEDVELVAAQ